MQSARWRRLDALFDAALACSPEDREGFVARSCADDPTLRVELAALLEAHAASGLLDRPPAALEVPTLATPGPPAVLPARPTGGSRSSTSASPSAWRAAPRAAATRASRAPAASSDDAGAAGRPARTEPASLAVLPFVDLSPQHDQSYFCDGIAEEILDCVARIDGLRVAARTSSFCYRGVEDVRRIGGELRVSTVLEGSVRKQGERLRVTWGWSPPATAASSGRAASTGVWRRSSPSRRRSPRRPRASCAASSRPPSDGRCGAATPPTSRPTSGTCGAGSSCCPSSTCGRRARCSAAPSSSTPASPSPGRASPTPAPSSPSGAASPSSSRKRSGRAPAPSSSPPTSPRPRWRAGRPSRCCGTGTRPPRPSPAPWSSTRAPSTAVPVGPRLLRSPCICSPSATSPWAGAKTRWRPRARRSPARAASSSGIRATPAPTTSTRWSSSGSASARPGLADIQRALAIGPEDPHVLHNAVCFFSLYGDTERALALLERTVAHGFGQRDWVEHDPDFLPLADDPRFHALLARMR